MAVVDKKTFADMCGKTTNNLSVSIGRDKTVILLSDDKIDTEDPRNKAYFLKWSARNADKNPKLKTKIVKGKASVEKKSDDDSEEEEEVSIENIKRGPSQTYSESERLLKYYDTKKRIAEIEKLELQIQKSKGEVVPTASIKPLFLEHQQSIIATVHDKLAELVRLFSKKHSLSIEENAELTGNVTRWVNESMEKALDVSVKKIEATILEYSESKGIGEHG